MDVMRVVVPEPLKAMLLSCVDSCDPKCCDAEAMDFSIVNFWRWMVDQPPDRRLHVRDQMTAVLGRVRSIRSAEICSDDLNEVWSSAEAERFFADLEGKLRSAWEACERGVTPA